MGAGTQQYQSQTLDKQGFLYSMNVEEFIQHVQPVDLDVTSSRLASGSGLRHRVSLPPAGNMSSKSSEKPANDGQLVLGEMTLEDYLANYGIVDVGADMRRNETDSAGMPSYSQGMRWQHHLYHHHHHHHHQQALMGVCVPTRMTNSAQMMEAVSGMCQGRRRVAAGDVATKTVERRQKRMIKNRESAARSRARKQAYTHELENKVSVLEEENEKLKKKMEFEKAIYSIPQPEPIYRLRRTSSAPS